MGIPLRLYDDPYWNRQHEPGDVVDCPTFHQVGECPSRWSNCDGHHILVYFPARFPDGSDGCSSFDICARASNCTMPDDREHRCWVVHGTLPALTVDKNGRTCQAGAGSFGTRGGWHGFITNGELV